MKRAFTHAGWIAIAATCVQATVLAEGPKATFYLSFDVWPIADLALGDRTPLRTIGAPRLGPGRWGMGLHLDGGSYLEFSPKGNISGQAATICLWVRLDQWGSRTYDNFLGLSDHNENALHLERSHPDGRLRVVLGGPGTTDGSKTRSLFSKHPLENGRWYHVAVAWDSGKPLVELYLDGELQERDDKPGPFPTSPPTLLVGAGFGRLERSVTGVIDELRIYGSDLSKTDVMNEMNRPSQVSGRTVLSGCRVMACVLGDEGTVTVGERPEVGGRYVFGPLQPTVQVDGRTFAARRWETVAPPATQTSVLGPVRRLTCRAVPINPDGPSTPGPVSLQLHVEAFQDHPVVLMWVDVLNTGKEAIRVGQIGLQPAGDGSNVCMILPASRAWIFTDSGGLTGSGVHRLSAPEVRNHGSHGAMVIADEHNDTAVGFSGVSFDKTSPNLVLTTAAGGGARRLEVRCTYPGGWRVAPGQTAGSEKVAFHLPPAGHLSGLAGHAVLEHWADLVMGVNNLSPPKHCPSGYNSWYAYRLVISEDLVLANARIIQKRFAPLGCTNFQIDHGWQYKDVCGHWVPNDRFPHGFAWLTNELKKMGLTFGLWTAVSQMSEFAPFCKEHPEALAKDAQGQPLVTDPHWYWVPHGKCYLVDPTHPLGEAFYEQAGRLVREHGSSYTKNDFQGNLLMHGLNLHDKDAIRGVPVWRKGMAAFRRGMGDGMAYHACNAPLNAVAGLCDVAWVHVDLGNPGGRWDWLAQWTDHFATRYHVSGKFYWCDPDYLQVGQGDLAETRWRIAMVGLGGGPTFICDRLPDLPEERLAMIPWVLPGYRRIARPIDLFDHEGYARVWHLPVETPWARWHVLGVFNLDNSPVRLPVRLERLGLDSAQAHLIMDFFAGRPAGTLQVPTGLGASLDIPLEPHQTKLFRITPIKDSPTVVGTDMHVTQGGVELPEVAWDPGASTLRGRAVRAPGMKGRIFIYVPPGYEVLDKVEPVDGRVVAVPVAFDTAQAMWSVRFRRG